MENRCNHDWSLALEYLALIDERTVFAYCKSCNAILKKDDIIWLLNRTGHAMLDEMMGR